MKRTIAAIFAASLLSLSAAVAQTAGDDMKHAGTETKNAAKDVGNGTVKATKKTGKAVAHGTKKAAHATASGTEKGAEKIKEKTQ